MTVNEGSSSAQPLGFCMFLNNLGASFLVLQLHCKLKLQGPCWLSMLLREKTRNRKYFQNCSLNTMCRLLWPNSSENMISLSIDSCVQAQRAGDSKKWWRGIMAGTQFLFTFSRESNRAKQGTLLAHERGVVTVAWVPCAPGS